MEMTTDRVGDVTRITLSGSLDFKSAPDLESRIASIGDSVKSAVVDLSAIDYLSSIGVRALLSTGKAIAARGGKIVLLNPQELVRTVLFTTGVNNVMPIVFDGDEAMRIARGD
jgi:anti-sigma B factor antagonist